MTSTAAGSNPAGSVKKCPKCRKVREFYPKRSVCKECHRKVTKSNSKKHYQENKSYYLARNKEQVRKLQEMIREAKSVPCMDCKKPFPYYVMDFDHVRGKKLFNISEGFRLCAPLKMAAEIAKCDVVCANCHRERTQVRFESGREC